MKKLFLLRHGDAKTGQSDPERPLSCRGREEAGCMGVLLRESGNIPDFVLHSSALRTQETADIVLDHAGAIPERFSSRQLYLASPDMILMQAAGVPSASQSLLIVGHNPGISGLAMHLGLLETFPTCGLGIFYTQAETWAEISRQNTKAECFFIPKS